MLLLKNFDCHDAIILCNLPNAHIIWKENIIYIIDFISNSASKMSM